jgi:hypothetical protein
LGFEAAYVLVCGYALDSLQNAYLENVPLEIPPYLLILSGLKKKKTPGAFGFA